MEGRSRDLTLAKGNPGGRCVARRGNLFEFLNGSDRSELKPKPGDQCVWKGSGAMFETVPIHQVEELELPSPTPRQPQFQSSLLPTLEAVSTWSPLYNAPLSFLLYWHGWVFTPQPCWRALTVDTWSHTSSFFQVLSAVPRHLVNPFYKWSVVDRLVSEDYPWKNKVNQPSSSE